MVPPVAEMQEVSLEGEVVEILEQSGRRLAKIAVSGPVMLEVANGGTGREIHLGDRVVVHGFMGVEKEAI